MQASSKASTSCGTGSGATPTRFGPRAIVVVAARFLAAAALPAKTHVGDDWERRINVWRVSRRAPQRFTARAYLLRRPVCWTQRLDGRRSVGDEELLHRHADVSGDLAKQCRRDVTTRMEWDRRDPAVRVAELLVRAAADHPRAASRSPRGGCPPTRDCPHPGCARRATPGHAQRAGWFADHAQRPLGMFSQRAPPDVEIPRMQTVGQRRASCPTRVVPTR